MALWHFLLSVLLSLSGTEGRVITLVNKCNASIWPGIQVGILIANESTAVDDGFELKSGESINMTTPEEIWAVVIWGRTGCSFNDFGTGTCVTGDCNGSIRCAWYGPVAPITFATIFLNNTGFDNYGVDLSAGFNIPVTILPYGNGSRECKSPSCDLDLNRICLEEFQVRSNGTIVGCQSACGAFDKPEFCCDGDYYNPISCKPTNYSMAFKAACPTAVTYPYDASGVFQCRGPNYIISFC